METRCSELHSQILDIIRSSEALKNHSGLELESEWILEDAFHERTGERLTRNEVHSDLPCNVQVRSLALSLARERACGVPLQYVLGHAVFRNHDYEVNSTVLCPRPETEVLVEKAIERLHDPSRGAEVGVGSGVISIELLSEFQSLKLDATDASEGALKLARRNADRILEQPDRLHLIRVQALEVLEPFRDLYSFIVSNPPYIEKTDELEPSVSKYEPQDALFPRSYLFFYKKIAEQAKDFLLPKGQVMVEINSNYAREIQGLFSGSYQTEVFDDLSGRPRVLLATVN